MTGMALTEEIRIAIHQRRSEREYWTALLAGHPERPCFALDFAARTAIPAYRDYTFPLNGDAIRLSGGSQQRLLIALAAATGTFLHRCTEAVAFTLGMPILRQTSGGPIINTLLPLCISIAAHDSFKELIYRVRTRFEEALANANFPIGAWAASRGAEGRLFDVALSLENITDGLLLDAASPAIMFLFTQEAERLSCTLRYDSNVFAPESVQLLSRRFSAFLDRVCRSPLDSVAGADLFLPGEREQWAAYNNTAAPFPADRTLNEIFREHAAQHPELVAIWFNDLSLTYAELERRSNQIAQLLRARGAGPESIVAINSRRSLELMAALLGILKSGAAYLPIDPNEPAARQDFKVRDSGVRIAIDHSAGPQLQCSGVLRLDLNDPAIFEGSDDAPESLARPENLAYVIYTSGSTGNPKGVGAPHRGVVNRLHWGQQQYPLTRDDILLQKTPLIFDVSLYELFWWMWAGASVRFLPPDVERDPRGLAEMLVRSGVTVVHFVPSMLTAYLDELRRSPASLVPRQLRLVLASGEALRPDHVQEFHRIFRGAGNKAPLVNLYGPTEASIEVSWFETTPEPTDRIPIGRPISNVRMYVLDRNMALRPPGLPGELYLGGECVTRGYVNRPGLTAANFVPDPLTPGRIYRTGDLAQLLPNGEMAFLGRRDNQLKIRGLRVETGEIEHRLREHPGIRAAAVCPEQRQSETTLQAYLVLENLCEVTTQALRDWLSERLPDYMTPAAFFVVPDLPLLPSGKLDRGALAERAVPLPSGFSYVPPRDRTEAEIAAVWGRILGLDRIGIDDSFFEIGGSSLTVLKVAANLSTKLEREIPVAILFEHTTIRTLARWLSGATSQAAELAAVDREAAESADIVRDSMAAFKGSE